MLKFDVNLSLVYSDLAMVDRPAAAARDGFSAMEAWWPFPTAQPTDTELEQLSQAFINSGAELVGLNFFAGDMAGGDRGIVSTPGMSQTFRDNVAVTLAFAEMVGGCPVFNALYGNRIPGASPTEQDEVALENLTYACQEAAKVGAKVVVEALNTFENPDYPLTSTAAIRSLINRVSERSGEQLYYLYDAYHLQRMEGNLIATIEKNLDVIGHVQVADSPGRHEPGTGEINYPNVLQALDAAGYSGWVGLEYRPISTAQESFGWIKDISGEG